MSLALRAAPLALLLMSIAGHGVAADDPAIDYLLSYVAESPCLFVRNGTRHSGPEAAEHLRMKYEHGKAYVSSAEQFIDRIASRSSWTGSAYSVECAPGETLSSAEWLRGALQQFREAAAGADPQP